MSRASELEQQMLELINEERTSRGLDPVALELRLNESSEDHSQWMLEEDAFSHTGEGGSSAGDRMRDADFAFEGNWTWGENIAYQSERGEPGLADDVENLHTALMNSPGHRANILNPDYEVVGLGIETGDFSGFDAVMVTQNFASTDAELQLDPLTGAASEPEPEPEPLPEPVAEAADDEDTPDPDLADDPEPEPVAETPEPETDEPEPVAEVPDPTPEPETDDPEPEPVSETPEPEEEPVDETPEPEEPEPVAEAPDTDDDDETPEPVDETPTDEPEDEDETPEVVNEDPDTENDISPLAQLQFFATGFLAALMEEEFTFTFETGDGEAQTVSFDLDDFFEDLLDGIDDGMDTDDDMMLVDQDTAVEGETAFQFSDQWDCLA